MSFAVIVNRMTLATTGIERASSMLNGFELGYCATWFVVVKSAMAAI